MTRRFAHVAGYEHVPLPTRATKGSAGYDLVAAEDVLIEPGGIALVPTGVKVYMVDGDALLVMLRSSLAKRGLSLANGIGVIDSDYVDNEDNEGHILVALRNNTSDFVWMKEGEGIAQGVFVDYWTTDDDDVTSERTGGFGSTGR